MLDDLVARARSTRSPVRKTELADLAIQYQVGRLLAIRVAWLQTVGKLPNYEAAMSKTYGSEMQQRIAAFAMRYLGLEAQTDEVAGIATPPAAYYQNSLSFTIAAGTSEVNRNIIATRGLGLPRG